MTSFNHFNADWVDAYVDPNEVEQTDTEQEEETDNSEDTVPFNLEELEEAE